VVNSVIKSRVKHRYFFPTVWSLKDMKKPYYYESATAWSLTTISLSRLPRTWNQSLWVTL
jgi:hypothetical protein